MFSLPPPPPLEFHIVPTKHLTPKSYNKIKMLLFFYFNNYLKLIYVSNEAKHKMNDTAFPAS